MHKQPHQFNFHLEHEKLVFSAVVGSRLVGSNKENSDIDKIDLYSHSVHANPFFEYPIGEEIVSIENKDTMQESCAALLINFASMLLQPKTLNANTMSQLIKHLAAIKFNKVEVFDEEKYNLYVDLLQTPGYGNTFWQQALIHYNNFWNCMPTIECNWSQKFDENNRDHVIKKEEWFVHNLGYFPQVDSKVGFDVKYVSWMLTDIILIKHILWNEHLIDTDELQILIDIKNSKMHWTDVKDVKNKLWKNARNSVESPNSSYLLGNGFDIETAKNKGLFGIKGLLNFIESVQYN